MDDHLAEQLRLAASERGQSLSAFLADAGRASLRTPEVASKPFELVTYGKSGAYPGISLDRTGDLLAAEDRETYGGSK